MELTLRPSSADRWYNCVPSIQLETEVNVDTETTFTSKGTEQHRLISNHLKLGLKSYSDDMTEDAKLFCNEIKKYLFTNVCRIDIEETLELKGTLVRGTPDIVIRNVDTQEIFVIDYKSGYETVSANSLQLKTYAAMVYEQDVFSGDITCVVWQGANSLEECFLSNSVTYEAGELDRYVGYLSILSDEIKNNNFSKYSFNPSEKTCRWCKAKPICRAYSEELEVDVPVVKPNRIPNSQLVQLVKKHKSITKYIDLVIDFLRNELESGVKIEGLGLKKGRSMKYWISESDAISTLESLGIDPFEKKLLSPSKALKEVGKTGDLDFIIEEKRAKSSVVADDMLKDFEELENLDFF